MKNKRLIMVIIYYFTPNKFGSCVIKFYICFINTLKHDKQGLQINLRLTKRVFR